MQSGVKSSFPWKIFGTGSWGGTRVKISEGKSVKSKITRATAIVRLGRSLLFLITKIPLSFSLSLPPRSPFSPRDFPSPRIFLSWRFQFSKRWKRTTNGRNNLVTGLVWIVDSLTPYTRRIRRSGFPNPKNTGEVDSTRLKSEFLSIGTHLAISFFFFFWLNRIRNPSTRGQLIDQNSSRRWNIYFHQSSHHHIYETQ